MFEVFWGDLAWVQNWREEFLRGMTLLMIFASSQIIQLDTTDTVLVFICLHNT